jgi:transposase-like protein
MIYTTNPVEALHRVIRKLVKGKAAWSSRTALIKQLYLSLMQNKKSWKRKAYDWKSIQLELLNQYPERINPHVD